MEFNYSLYYVCFYDFVIIVNILMICKRVNLKVYCVLNFYCFYSL